MTITVPPSQLNVYLLPELARPGHLAGRSVVVIDVLRATTTMATALANGAREIIPCQTVEQAREIAGQPHRLSGVLLGGERGGQRIDGFDLGNSPGEYSPGRVDNRQIIFTTTNGTRALSHCQRAGRVLLASFANLGAICDHLATASGVDLVCAGTGGQVSWEDTLCAGAVVQRLVHGNAILNDAARLTVGAWTQLGGSATIADELARAMRTGRGGQNLMALDLEQDIQFAAQIDRFKVVPELCQRDNVIRLANPSGKV